MFINIFKKGYDTLTTGVDTWIVEWTKRVGQYSSDTRQCYRAFTDKDEAKAFAESIRRAHELIGNTSGISVSVYREEHIGLME